MQAMQLLGLYWNRTWDRVFVLLPMRVGNSILLKVDILPMNVSYLG